MAKKYKIIRSLRPQAEGRVPAIVQEALDYVDRNGGRVVSVDPLIAVVAMKDES